MINPNKIFEINSPDQFETVAVEIFRFQAEHCEPYKRYLSLLGTDVCKVVGINEIPFFPIQFFKTENVICDRRGVCGTHFNSEHITKSEQNKKPDQNTISDQILAPYQSVNAQEVLPQKIFTSSATTGMTPSRHPIVDLSIYERSFSDGFRLQYGNPSEYAILALLPSYLERAGSSLVYMTESLMKQSANPNNGYYLYNHTDLYDMLYRLRADGQKTILIGVSFALLDFISALKLETGHRPEFPDLIVVETGGMKGRGEELSREELHSRLKEGFGVDKIHSEYGMAELLSQAWSKGDSLFFTPPWMKILIRDLNNPFHLLSDGERGGNDSKRGGINIIDLANVYSCSFIETEDMGMTSSDGGFKIFGRIKNSELRGCNFLIC
ncbi:MAG: hypothetical protein A2X18_04700 [Bacteroidetes bacterium GWF2_40_14]|nr:MAG: hypothetical protein A2X18_04700 [Bacteroidetes bacterium GWF2_40_14]